MLKGRTEPRLFTQPNRELTPETSLGFDLIEFSRDVCGLELLPWQQWVAIHALELNEDGTFRFRRALIVVGRQSGKTTLLKVLALWVMTRTPGRTVLGVAKDLQLAKESWQGCVDLMERPQLTPLLAPSNPVRRSSGDICLTLANKSRYRIAAANSGAGRGMSVNLLILDELRQMKSEAPYQALAPTTAAQPDGMVFCISNAGEADSIVLNKLRDVALAAVEPAVGIFEWSAEDDCALDDPDAWRAANPGLGVTVQEAELRVALATFSPNKFRIEHLCQRVDSIDTAIDLSAWQSCADNRLSLADARDRLAMCLDVSPDLSHVTLVGAALRGDGRVGFEAFAAWDSTDAARRDLPGLIERYAPQQLGWYGNGPSAALAADLRRLRNAVEIKPGDVPAICQGLAEQVTSRRVLHPNDPLLNAHIGQATAMPVGDGWRFARKDDRNCDAAYAVAGAVHLARTMKPTAGKQFLLMV